MNLSGLVQVGFLTLAIVAILSFGSTARDGEQRRMCTPLCALSPNYAGLDKTAPDFDLPRLGGGNLKLSSLKGKVVILNFWTKTCKPCMEEMPALARLGKLLSSRDDIVLVTITTDETLEDANATLRGVLGDAPNFEVLLDNESKIVSGKYGTKLYPETWFIDPNGVIRARFDGPREWDSPLVMSFAESLTLPLTCAIEYRAGRATGPTWLCEG